MEIIRGKLNKAKKVVIYGPEGIGKSTLASKFPDPIFIDTEDSTASMDVARTSKPTSWPMLLSFVDNFRNNPSLCKTLVIDTADWAEKLLIENLLAKHKWNSIESPGYGKGYTVLEEAWGKEFLDKLTEVMNAGINVVLTAHAQMRKFEKPDELGAYDRWELKLAKKIAAITKEWADMVLFCNYHTDVISDPNSKRKIATGGKRVMHTTHHPAWDAKNREGLPDELPMDFSSLAGVFEADLLDDQQLKIEEVSQQKTADFAIPISEKDDLAGIPEQLADLMTRQEVSEEEVRKACASKGYFPEDMAVKDYPEDFIAGVLVGAWEQVYDIIKTNRQELPFTI